MQTLTLALASSVAKVFRLGGVGGEGIVMSRRRLRQPAQPL